MKIRSLAATALLVCTAFTHAQAATALPGDGSWSSFDVDNFLASSGGVEWIDLDGQALSFSFTIAAGQQGVLNIVDAGLAGDTFQVFNGATLLGSTSSVAVTSYDVATPIVVDFDAAWADSSYSRASYTLGAGTYSITGLLDQSVLLDGSPLPEPTGLVLAFAGLGALAARRRRAR
jgi:MYXO-CTERM domain-containing protein